MYAFTDSKSRYSTCVVAKVLRKKLKCFCPIYQNKYDFLSYCLFCQKQQFLHKEKMAFQTGCRVTRKCSIELLSL